MAKLQLLNNDCLFDGKVKNGQPFGKGIMYFKETPERNIIKEGSYQKGYQIR